MSYGEVKLDTLRDVGGEYEDPDRLARSEQCGDRNYNIMNQQGVQPYKK